MDWIAERTPSPVVRFIHHANVVWVPVVSGSPLTPQQHKVVVDLALSENHPPEVCIPLFHDPEAVDVFRRNKAQPTKCLQLRSFLKARTASSSLSLLKLWFVFDTQTLLRAVFLNENLMIRCAAFMEGAVRASAIEYDPSTDEVQEQTIELNGFTMQEKKPINWKVDEFVQSVFDVQTRALYKSTPSLSP
jgi:hypothetical protein